MYFIQKVEVSNPLIFRVSTSVLDVMLRTPRLAGQAFFCGNSISHLHSSSTRLRFTLRLVSTNAAIHRGIRKSTRAGERDGPRSRYDGARETAPSGEQGFLSARPRRPNHQQQQDVDDMKESENRREGRLTLRQQKYLRGGREEPAPQFRQNPRPRLSSERFKRGGAYKNSTLPTNMSGRDRSAYGGSTRAVDSQAERPRFGSRHGAIASSFNAHPPSGLPNRAARRASIYGHDVNPPPGYKPPRHRGSEDDRSSVGHPESRNSFAPQRSANTDNFHSRLGRHVSNGIESRATDDVQDDSSRFSGRKSSFHDAGDSTSRSYLPHSAEREERLHKRELEEHQNLAGDSLRSSDSRPSYAAARGPPWDLGIDPVQSDKDRQRPGWKVRAPLSIPYTTPASEFLYGTSVITAALKSDRRKMYKLYLYDGENRENVAQDTTMRKLALSRGVAISRVQGDWLRLMDKMSAGRPHNGYILEASPLPKLPVVAFKPVLKQQAPFHIVLDHQSREEEAINGIEPKVKYQVGFPRFPFVLLLDGILDPGNLGAIMRTAYFLGIDAVAISNRNSAPFTPVTLKASAGASESLPLMSISQPGKFIDECQDNGWKFYAAVAPGSILSASGPVRKPYFSTSTLGCPVRDHPCVLILGGEGEGLRWNIQRKADYVIGIEGQRAGQGGVDSLNVSVAAGLLCEAFMRRPVRNTPNVFEPHRDTASINPVYKVGEAGTSMLVNATFDGDSSSGHDRDSLVNDSGNVGAHSENRLF